MAVASKVELGDHFISTQSLGGGGTLIVLLNGWGVLSPILEYRALSALLAEQSSVLVIESPGCGESGATAEERTIEAIVRDLHEVIARSGHKQYILLGHSISGVYALFYANRYPEEVLAFIGIDSSVPKQIDHPMVQAINLLAAHLTRLMRKSGLLALTARKPSGFMPAIEGVVWSEDEIDFYKRLYLENSVNDTVLNELRNAARNFRAAYALSFPETVPVLYFLSSQSSKQVRDWEQLHAGTIRDKERSRIVAVDGPHFLHYGHSRQMAAEIRSWLSEVGL